MITVKEIDARIEALKVELKALEDLRTSYTQPVYCAWFNSKFHKCEDLYFKDFDNADRYIKRIFAGRPITDDLDPKYTWSSIQYFNPNAANSPIYARLSIVRKPLPEYADGDRPKLMDE